MPVRLHKYSILTLFVGMSLATFGQTIPTITNQISGSTLIPDREIILNNNNWLITNNPSAIGVYSIPDIGVTQVGANYLNGDYKRVQQAKTINSVGFSSNSYKTLDKLHLFGDFCFTQERRNGILYCDNLLPFDGNPYILGSNIPGKYSNQFFKFRVMAASNKLSNFYWTGIGFDYDIGDYSRLQDPRSRVSFVDLNLRPGIVFEINKQSKVGINLLYRYRKEKSNNYVSKAQDSKDYLIYRQEGLGVYSTIVSTSITRRIKGNYIGGEVQFENKKENNSLIISAGTSFRADKIEDVNRSCPGEYADMIVSMNARYRMVDGDRINLFSLNNKYVSGNAKKDFQELITSTDPESGVVSSYYKTIFKVDSYRTSILSSNFQYRYFNLIKDNRSNWYFGADISYNQFTNEYTYLSPTSLQTVRTIDPSITGGLSIAGKKKTHINLNMAIGYLLNIENGLTISSGLQDREIVEKVIEPDSDILGMNAAHCSFDMNILFPFSKGSKISLMIAPYYTIYSAQQGKYRQLAGISIGILQ